MSDLPPLSVTEIVSELRFLVRMAKAGHIPSSEVLSYLNEMDGVFSDGKAILRTLRAELSPGSVH